MSIIDVQVHAYEHNHPGRLWVGHIAGPDHVTGDEMVAAIDAVGVDGAILVSPFSLYRYDASYAVGVYAAYPARFRLIKPVDTTDTGVADVIADWKTTKGTVGIRVFLNQDTSPDPSDPGINRALAAAAKNSMPVNLAASGRLDQVAGLAARNPDTVLVVDHLGLQQPFHPPAPPRLMGEPAKVLALASQPNVRIKISGACTLSHEPYPYNDIWPPVLQIIEAFGIDRCMWGTDWTRATELLTYEQGVESFRKTNRLSDSDKAKLMGATLEKVYGW